MIFLLLAAAIFGIISNITAAGALTDIVDNGAGPLNVTVVSVVLFADLSILVGMFSIQ